MSPTGEFDDKVVLFQRRNISNDDILMSFTFARKQNYSDIFHINYDLQ